jgi:hypothetical protein
MRATRAMHVDLFDFFRYALAWVVSIYATVVTLQSLYGWYVYLSGQGRYHSLMRRYLMLQGLRLRIKAFGGDTLICILLTVAMVLLLRAHQLVARIDSYPHSDGRRVTTTR